jgi:GTPase
MNARIVEQAEAAIADADLVLFVVDATVGALEDDERYAKLLRRSGVPRAARGQQGRRRHAGAARPRAVRLGLGEPHPVSARHGRGVGDLLDEVLDALPGDAAARGRRPSTTRGCPAWRSSASRTSASRRCSTGCSARSGRSSTRSPHHP